MKYLRKFNNVNDYNSQKKFLYSLEELQNTVVCGIKNNSTVINDVRYVNTDMPNECPIFVRLDHGDIPSSTGFYIYVVWPKLNVTVSGTLSIYVVSTNQNPPRKYYYRTNSSPTDCTAEYSFDLDGYGYDLEDGDIPWDIYEAGDVVKDYNGNESWMFTSTSYQNMQVELDMTATWYGEDENDWYEIPVVLYLENNL